MHIIYLYVYVYADADIMAACRGCQQAYAIEGEVRGTAWYEAPAAASADAKPLAKKRPRARAEADSEASSRKSTKARYAKARTRASDRTGP